MKRTILFVDNNHSTLEKRGKLLRNAGYTVRLASTPGEARSELVAAGIDLAVIDVRLKDDDNEHDISGFELARTEAFRHIPKIILTSYPIRPSNLREVLASPDDELSSVVAFVGKSEGPQALITQIQQHTPSQVTLEVAFSGPQSFHSMAAHILGDGLADDELNDRAGELEHLVRRLLHDCTRAEFESVLLQRKGQALIRGRLWREDGQVLRRLLKCGRREAIFEEQRAYKDKAEYVGEWAVQQRRKEFSFNLGALAYSAPGFDLERAHWLADYFELLTAEEVNSLLDNLFDQAQRSLYSQPCPIEKQKTLNCVFRERLGLVGNDRQESFRQGVAEAIGYIRSYHQTRVQRESDPPDLVFFSNEGRLSYPEPTRYVFEDAMVLEPPVLRRWSLGCMDGRNVLADREGRAWVTEFRSIGPAPTPSDFVALEARMRFEWVETAQLDWSQLQRFEAALDPSRSHEEPVSEKLLEDPHLAKALLVIGHLRALAENKVSADPKEYQLGLLYQTAHILTDDVPLYRKAHALLAAGRICRVLQPWAECETA